MEQHTPTGYGYGASAEELTIDPVLVRRCNDQSQFHAGDGLEAEARRTYMMFFERFPLSSSLEFAQTEHLVERSAIWKELVEASYTDQLVRRSQFVPVNVAGPSNYNGRKMDKIADRNIQKSIEWADKMNRFLDNTEKKLKELEPIESVLERIRTRRGDDPHLVIQSDDPYAIEKLEAKLEYHTTQHAKMKATNAYYRKHGTLNGFDGIATKTQLALERGMIGAAGVSRVPFPGYMLTNNNATIKSTQLRLNQLREKKVLGQSPKGYEFEGGSVVLNYEMDRLQMLFDDKPDYDLRCQLKAVGFTWSPKQKAWQRRLTPNAEAAAKKILQDNELMEV